MWLPASLLLAAWLGYGVLQWRRSHELLAKMDQLDRGKRKAWGTLLLIGSALILVAGLYAISLLGSGDTLSPLQWAAAGVVGLLFIHCQVTAAMMLASLGDFRNR